MVQKLIEKEEKTITKMKAREQQIMRNRMDKKFAAMGKDIAKESASIGTYNKEDQKRIQQR